VVSSAALLAVSREFERRSVARLLALCGVVFGVSLVGVSLFHGDYGLYGFLFSRVPVFVVCGGVSSSIDGFRGIQPPVQSYPTVLFHTLYLEI